MNAYVYQTNHQGVERLVLVTAPYATDFYLGRPDFRVEIRP